MGDENSTNIHLSFGWGLVQRLIPSELDFEFEVEKYPGIAVHVQSEGAEDVVIYPVVESGILYDLVQSNRINFGLYGNVKFGGSLGTGQKNSFLSIIGEAGAAMIIKPFEHNLGFLLGFGGVFQHTVGLENDFKLNEWQLSLPTVGAILTLPVDNAKYSFWIKFNPVTLTLSPDVRFSFFDGGSFLFGVNL